MDDMKFAAPRETYEPPIVEDIPLRTDEQLLAGCKQLRSGGPGNSSSCTGLGGGNPCTGQRQS